MPTPKDGHRSLTAGEILILRKIFKNAINYSAVKVHNGKWIQWQRNDITMTPNGNIYFNQPTFKEDFSTLLTSQPDALHHFIHEMVHVWQYQLGYAVKRAGLLSAFGYGYDYTFKANTRLSDYPMEAQGNIIADWAMYVLYGVVRHCSRTRYGKKPIHEPNSKRCL
jgi:hypothetical protein